MITGINFSAETGEFLCIAGPNGCGKSTLLKSLINIQPYRGTIYIDGKEASSFKRKPLAAKAALLGQVNDIYFPYTVRSAVSLGRYAYTTIWQNSLSKNDNDIVSDILERLELTNISERLISELSGGQLQRVFLARALVQTPDILLLDEPTNHLDLKHQLELLDFLKIWVKDHNRTVIAVLHDLNLIQCYADKAIIMRAGKIAAYGTPSAVMDGSLLHDVYGTDVRGFMLDSLARWTFCKNQA